MKISVDEKFPSYFKPLYDEEFNLFSHLEVASSIPQALFAITTYKENGMPNVCFHSWSCFHGDKTAFFAVMGNLYQHTHTFANIKREKCFGINFLPIKYYDKLVDTINKNQFEADEFEIGGFTIEKAAKINAPLISESFMNMECTLDDIRDLSGAGITAMITGRVRRVAVDESYASGYKRHNGEEGYMLLVPSPQNLITGQPNLSAIAVLDIKKFD